MPDLSTYDWSYFGEVDRLTTPNFRSTKEADYTGKEAQNRELGFSGEKLVLELEKKQLIAVGRNDLAERIRHVSDVLGDGAGYDIESYTPEGDIKYIEVKTTKGAKTASFFISSNELAFAKLYKDNYYLYRVFEYDKDTNVGKCFILRNIENNLVFSPIEYRVSFGSVEIP